MKKYKCMFPGCSHETDNKSFIEFHHIFPRELRVKLNSYITVSLCPLHHKYIYHPQSQSGQHSIKHKESLEILGIFNSSNGEYIRYMDNNEKTIDVFFRKDKKDSVEQTYMLKWDMLKGLRKEPYDGDLVDDVLLKKMIELGSEVYYIESKEQDAYLYLKKYLENYTRNLEKENENTILKCVNDWKEIKKHIG